MTWLIAARVFSWFEKVIRIHQWRWKNIVVWANHPAGALDKHCCGFYPPLATGTPPMVMVPFCNSWEFDRNGQALPNFLDLCFDLLRTTRKPGLCHHCRSTMKLKRQRIVHFRGPIYIYIYVYIMTRLCMTCPHRETLSKHSPSETFSEICDFRIPKFLPWPRCYRASNASLSVWAWHQKLEDSGCE